MNIPFAAGLASSACGFAALIKSINQLFGWQLDNTTLSMLARIGSGSACRSLWNGFVEWHKGCNADGSDSFASPLKKVWPDLCLGILITSEQCKPISSREAMRKTVNKSMRYRAWPEIVSNHLEQIKLAIESEDFSKLGRTCEKNAVAMHQTMLDINPSIIYGNEQTVAAIESVHMARRRGIECFYTQDAGPNLKIIHQKKDNPLLRELFPRMITINPFSD